MSQTKFLITGATGATGGDAVLQLLEKGRDVRALAGALVALAAVVLSPTGKMTGRSGCKALERR